MSIIEYTGPSNPQEIRKYLMRRTKDQIVWEYLRLWREYGELEKERNALAAKLECWHDVYVDLTNNMVMFDGVSHYVADNAMMRRFDEIDESAPTTSLSRLKAEWQAELLGKVRTFDIHTDNGDMRHDAERRAGWNACLDELRRQAEGGE